MNGGSSCVAAFSELVPTMRRSDRHHGNEWKTEDRAGIAFGRAKSDKGHFDILKATVVVISDSSESLFRHASSDPAGAAVFKGHMFDRP
jgi:hypothetical protein